MWPPHGHRHTAQPPLAGSRAGSRDESCARLCLHLWPWELTKGPWPYGTLGGPWPSGTHGHSFPLVHGHSFLVANTLRQPWPMAAFVSRRPSALAASNLRRPLAHGAPLATIGYQGVVVIRNGRVIEPIVRGGGHGGRGGRSGLGRMSWWCGGMSWKWCGRKAKGHEGL